MKSFTLLTAAFLLVGGAAMAQSNATKEGNATPAANGAGAPEASSSAGSVTTSTGAGTAAPATK